MKPERWKQVDELLEAALERRAAERASFLDRACAGDEELRRELESLLIADAQAETFIESPPARVAADLFTDNQPKPGKGERIAHYEILAPIGSGGMGEVYLAQDSRLGRQVALKLLPAQFSRDVHRLHRFEREARSASALNHPNIITIHEVGRVEDAPFIITEFIEGQTLRRLMASRQMSVGETLDIAIQVASALEAAHKAGIVHRDIKPENIMLRPDGLVKVLDFGLAKLSEVESRPAEASAPTLPASVETKSGLVIGTVTYMSPEQARGLVVDRRSDIFSLGTVISEMITGQVPFGGGTTADVIVSILEKDPEPIGRLRPGLPPELERIVNRMLAKEREARYQSAGELRAELQLLQRKAEASIEETVGRAEVTAGTQSGEKTKPEAPAVTTDLEEGKRQLLTWQSWQVAAIGLVVLVLAAAMAVKFFRRSPASPPSEIKSLAVLPLENLSGDPAQEYFADGMTDALIGDLAKIGALRVVSRTSAMRYKGTKKPLTEIAGELKVDAVVEGTVQRAGDRARIRVQLIQAATDRHLWVETYERDVRDVLGLQSEIARAIAREIQTQVTPAEQVLLTSTRTVNRKALDDYLQGRYHREKFTEAHLHKALEYFQSAISADPTYAPAYSGLAHCYISLGTGMISALPPKEARLQAEEAAGKALELDSGLADAHVVLGVVNQFKWNWSAAEQSFTRAIELAPSYGHAHNLYARYLAGMGRTDQAIAEINIAQQLDPLSLQISASRGFILLFARDYDEAIKQSRRVLDIDPNHYLAHWNLGLVYAGRGQLDEAVATFEKAADLSGREPGILGFLGMSYGFAGRKDEANKVLKELLGLERHSYVTPGAVAYVYVGLGNKDQAFIWLEKAFQEQSNYLAYFKGLPLLDPLRTDPRFDDIVRRIGLAQ